jgi:hypothetical protein
VQSVAPPADADADADPLAAALWLAAADGADVAAPPPLLVHAASARTLLIESATIRRFDILDSPPVP